MPHSDNLLLEDGASRRQRHVTPECSVKGVAMSTNLAVQGLLSRSLSRAYRALYIARPRASNVALNSVPAAPSGARAAALAIARRQALRPPRCHPLRVARFRRVVSRAQAPPPPRPSQSAASRLRLRVAVAPHGASCSAVYPHYLSPVIGLLSAPYGSPYVSRTHGRCPRPIRAHAHASCRAVAPRTAPRQWGRTTVRGMKRY